MEREIGATTLRDLYKLLDELIEKLPPSDAPRRGV